MTGTSEHPGAVVINGATYLHNARGDLVPLGNIKATDLLQDELVRRLCDYAEDLSAELARFQSQCYADIAAFDAILDQEYGAKGSRPTKGNRSFSTIDGSLQVKVSVADQIAFGPELQSGSKIRLRSPPYLMALPIRFCIHCEIPARFPMTSGRLGTIFRSSSKPDDWISPSVEATIESRMEGTSKGCKT